MLSKALYDKLRSPYVDSPCNPKFVFISVRLRPGFWAVFVAKSLLIDALNSESILVLIAVVFCAECCLVVKVLGFIFVSYICSVFCSLGLSTLPLLLRFLVSVFCWLFGYLSWSRSYRFLVSFNVSFWGERTSGDLKPTGFLSPDCCSKVSVKILCYMTVLCVVISLGFKVFEA